MRRMLLKWYYGRKLRKACKILSWQYRRHKDAGHEVYFNAEDDVNISFACVNCTETQPLRRKPEDAEHITRVSYGKPYTG